jgi:hypothetical protein
MVIIHILDYNHNPYSVADYLGGGSYGLFQGPKEKTHKRIVAIASKRFREKGLVGFGVTELMKEAGLTVGGFYKHFDSRDELWPRQSAMHSVFGSVKKKLLNPEGSRYPSRSLSTTT